jgi:4-amino-4-deoxy-L-arabinose transferase-like glycosyltransferase
MATTLRRAMVWLQHPWLIVGVALCLRVAWMVAYAPWDAPNERLISRAPNPDAGSYQEVALVLLRYWNKPGQAIVEMPEAIDSIIIRAPGYPLVMAVLYALLGVNPVWVVIVQVCASVLNCALVIAALRRISTPLGAAVGGWLFALNPTLIDYTQLILTETLFVLGLTLVLYAFAQFRAQPNPAVWRAGVGSGVALALTTLIRPSPLWLIPVLGVLGVFARPLSAQARGIWLAGYLAGVLALFVPWAAYNRVHYGSWRLTLAGELYLLDMTGLVVTQMQQPIHQARAMLEAEAFARMRNDGLDPDRQIFERGRYYRAVALDYIQQHPNEFAYYWLRGMLFFWRSAGGPNTGNEWMMSSRAVRRWFQGYYFAYLVALITGLWLTIRTRRQRWWAILFVLTAIYFTLSAGCSGNARFRLQTFVFSLPVIAIGLDSARQKRESGQV